MYSECHVHCGHNGHTLSLATEPATAGCQRNICSVGCPAELRVRSDITPVAYAQYYAHAAHLAVTLRCYQQEPNIRETIENTKKLTIDSNDEQSYSFLVLVRPFWFGTRRPEVRILSPRPNI